MLLYEFFNNPLNVNKKENDKSPVYKDDLFNYIIDHDKLHKDYFFPIAKKLKHIKDSKSKNIIELFMPMVIKGCKEFYNEQKMEGRLSKLFTKELREEICQRLYDHYYEDVLAGKYRLG